MANRRPLDPAFVGGQQSLLPSRLVGSLRLLGMTAAVGAAVGAGLLGYAHWESRRPILRRATLKVPGSRQLRILHISDLHMYAGQDFIGDFLAQVAAEEQIDLVVSTGDNLGDADGIDPLLAAHEPLLHLPGVFVLGSNDYYSPLNKPWLSYLRRDRHKKTAAVHANQETDLPWFKLVEHLTDSGWVDLSNRSATIDIPTEDGYQLVSLVGVDDPHIHRNRAPKVATSWSDPAALKLALTHAPYRQVLDQFSELGADLVMAGHTHGGQIRIPGFGALVTNSDLPRAYSRGLKWWPGPNGGTWVNVSAGLGTSPMAPIRFACRPEATLLTVT